VSGDPKTPTRPFWPVVAHQRLIREAEAIRDPCPVMATLDGCTVARIGVAEARPMIARYEWLGTMPRAPVAFYGLRTPIGELAGVVAFGYGGGNASADLCGTEWRQQAICLQRGACTHWAHPHAASFLIARACRLAAKDFGWLIFFAYADPKAGERGVIYQACNWRHVGSSTGRGAKRRWRFYSKREERWFAEKALTQRKIDMRALRSNPDWLAEKQPDKGCCFHFEGDRRQRRALKALRYPVRPYPAGRRRRHERRRSAQRRLIIFASVLCDQEKRIAAGPRLGQHKGEGRGGKRERKPKANDPTGGEG
jgi:hypothetical protein